MTFLFYVERSRLRMLCQCTTSDSVTVTTPVLHILSRRLFQSAVAPLRCAAALVDLLFHALAWSSVGSPRLLICRRGCLQTHPGACFVFTASGLPWRRGLRPPPPPEFLLFGRLTGRLPSASADPPLPPDEDHLCAKIIFQGL